MSTDRTNFERWLPIRVGFSPTTASVRWIDFGATNLSEPFFNHTLRKLRAMTPPAPERTTSLSDLLKICQNVPKAQPAGIIFHVSRCGSTLVANILKTGLNCAVLAEAHPIGTLSWPGVFKNSPFREDSGAEEVRKLLLDCMVSLYGAAFGSQLVIKCHAASILLISRLRSIWPTTPFLILIRDPVEVMISNLARPSGWLRSIHRRYGENLFGFSQLQTQQMTLEEYCARGVGAFLRAGLNQIDANCWVVDYRELNGDSLSRIAELFNIQIAAPTSPLIQQTLLSYSKDPLGSRTFQPDGQQKQLEAPISARDFALQWAEEPYQKLRKLRAFSAQLSQ